MEYTNISTSVLAFAVALSLLIWGMFSVQLIPNKKELERIKKSLTLPKTDQEREMAKMLCGVAQFMPWALALTVLFAAAIGFMLGKIAK